jgi:tRNA(fMet)-specific endonuclease VapC
MKYLLDTNICIYLIKAKPLSVLQTFQACEVGEVGVSSITVAELTFGVHKSHHVTQNRRALEQFLSPLIIAEFNYKAAQVYGALRAQLERQGTPIGALDMLIAAHALSLQIMLVTNNVKEFTRVPQLQVVNWVKE